MSQTARRPGPSIDDHVPFSWTCSIFCIKPATIHSSMWPALPHHHLHRNQSVPLFGPPCTSTVPLEECNFTMHPILSILRIITQTTSAFDNSLLFLEWTKLYYSTASLIICQDMLVCWLSAGFDSLALPLTPANIQQGNTSSGDPRNATNLYTFPTAIFQ